MGYVHGIERTGAAPAEWRVGSSRVDVLGIALAMVVCAGVGNAQCSTELGPQFPPSGTGFGESVAATTSRIAVGDVASPGQAGGSVNGGAVYVFDLIGGEWLQTDFVLASDRQQSDEFGADLVLEGDMLVVGAPGKNTNQGAVYVFERQGTTWSQSAKLPTPTSSGDRLGTAVASNGMFVFAGAPLAGSGQVGAVFVFEKQGPVWVQTQKLTIPGAPIDLRFGGVLDAQGDTLIVGAGGVLAGTVPASQVSYVYENQGGTWTESAQLPGAASVSIDGDLIATTNKANAYLHRNEGGNWKQIAALKPSPTLVGIGLGQGVSIRDGKLLLADERSVYVFEELVLGWYQLATLSQSPAEAVAITSDFAALGAPTGDQVSIINEPAGGWGYYSLPLVGCPPSLSLFFGGIQSLEIDAGPTFAGMPYIVLGSATGTSPGIDLGVGILPLNYDKYFAFTLGHANNPPPLSNTFAPLDSNGRGLARFVLPAGSDPGLDGVVLNHAAVVLDLFSFAVMFVSNAVSITLNS